MMTLKFITDYIDKKIKENERKVMLSFFEVRIKLNLSEEQTDEFLKLCRIRLENLGYQVYFTGAKYTYENENKVVQDNELLVAIKQQVFDN